MEACSTFTVVIRLAQTNQINHKHIHMSFADSKYGVVFVLDNKNLFNSRRFGMLEQKKHNVV